MACENEKTTQDPGKARESYRQFMRSHDRERMNRNSDGTRCRFPVPEGIGARVGGGSKRFGAAIAMQWSRAGVAGANIERSLDRGEKALKPLARISVYISAEAIRR